MRFAFYNGSAGVYNFLTGITPFIGGATKQQWLLAQTLMRNGHEVIFITPIENPKNSSVEIEGVRFIFSPRKTTNLTLKQILSDEKPSWLYWRTNSVHLGPCFYLAKNLGISLVYACASDKDCDPKRALNPFSYQKYLGLFYKWGIDQADCILVQHLGQRNLLGNRYLGKIRLVNNITDIPQIQKKKGKSKYIAWVGNLRYEKRPDILVDIAKRLPQYTFVVCGAALDYRSKSGYVDFVKNNLSTLPNVEYLGAIPPNETLSVIANASLFLSTSSQEGFPNTMLEAWSVGVPVISLKLDPGGTIHRHNLGYVTVDVAQTIMVTKQLMNSYSEITEMGENGIRYIVENHSPSVVYRQFVEALNII